jgi:hydroxymethylpyrimidine/phosphomethylpyrimidine kinase
MTPVVATVGTTHPLCFAGLTHALLALAADGVRPVCVVAGVSAQDAHRVSARVALEPVAIAAQFAALREAGVGAFHVGALLSADAVHAVAAGLATFAGVPVVVDPVLAASDGDPLADEATRRALREVLLPRATLFTPNLGEAAALLGRPVDDLAAMREAARVLFAFGAGSVLVKGGHLPGDDVVDVFADGGAVRELHGPRLPGFVRGSGDLLAVAAAAALARGATTADAVAAGRAKVRTALADAEPFAGTVVRRLRA